MNWLIQFFKNLFGSKPKPTPVDPPIHPPNDVVAFAWFTVVNAKDSQHVQDANIVIIPDLDNTPLTASVPVNGLYEVEINNKGLWKTGATVFVRHPKFKEQTFRMTLPDEADTKQTVELDPLPAIGPITVTGRVFRAPDGKEWKMKFVTDFALLSRWLNGENLDGLLEQRRQAGANGSRVLSGVNWLNLYPQARPDYYDQLQKFCQYTLEKQWYIELTVFAAVRELFPSLDQQLTHYHRVCDVVRNFPHVFLELVNENDHDGNTIDASKFTKPSDIVASHGSSTGGQFPVLPVWDYAGTHSERGGDWVNNVRFALSTGASLNAAVVEGEPIGAHEVNQPGRRDNNPENFYRAGRILGWGPGACFHSEAGLRSDPWGPIQFQCAQAFFQGMDEAARGESPRPVEMDAIGAPQGGNSFGTHMPETIRQSIKMLAAKYPGLLNGNEDERRQLMGIIAAQAAWCCGPSWGWKRADNGRPLSKDAIAQQQPDGKLYAWDCFTGAIPRQFAGHEAIDITGQVFVPVEPKNDLG